MNLSFFLVDMFELVISFVFKITSGEKTGVFLFDMSKPFRVRYKIPRYMEPGTVSPSVPISFKLVTVEKKVL